MKLRLTALLLVLILVSTIMVSAFATETTAPASGETTPETTTDATDTAAKPAEETANETAPDSAEEILKEDPVIAVEEASPNMIMFADLADRVKKNSPSYKAVQANAGAIDDAQEKVAQIESGLATINANLAGIEKALAPIDEAIAAIDADNTKTDEQKQAEKAPLLAQKAPYLAQKEILMDQKANAQSGLSGLSSLAGQNSTQVSASGYQVIMGCESMYIALVGLEIQEDALVRQLAALDRTIAELKVRQEWGQISQLQMMEAENGRASLVSGLTTLRMNMTNLRMQMENLMGEKITGTTEVGTLPRVTSEQLAAIDLEKDLKMVLRRSPAVQAAEDQESNLYSSGMSSIGGDIWDGISSAAEYGVKSAKLQAEMNFRSLYAELMDCRQVLTAAKASLEVEQLAYQAEELKYNKGTISKNAFLTAADELQTAKEAVLTAENNLFSTYNEYNWAVKHGIFM